MLGNNRSWVGENARSTLMENKKIAGQNAFSERYTCIH